MLDTGTVLALKPAEIAFPMCQKTVYLVNPDVVLERANEQSAKGRMSKTKRANEQKIAATSHACARARLQVTTITTGSYSCSCSSLYFVTSFPAANFFFNFFSATPTDVRRCGACPVNMENEMATIRTLFRVKSKVDDVPAKPVVDLRSLSAEDVADIFPPLPEPVVVPVVVKPVAIVRPAKTRAPKKEPKNNPLKPLADAIVDAYLKALGNAARDTKFRAHIRAGYELAERGYTVEQVITVYEIMKKTDKYWGRKFLRLASVAQEMTTVMELSVTAEKRKLDDGMDEQGRFGIRNTQAYKDDLAERQRIKTAEEQAVLDENVRRAKEDLARLMSKS